MSIIKDLRVVKITHKAISARKVAIQTPYFLSEVQRDKLPEEDDYEFSEHGWSSIGSFETEEDAIDACVKYAGDKAKDMLEKSAGYWPD